ncbi:hypothetical protein OROMI_033783 [Orobanche minor]
MSHNSSHLTSKTLSFNSGDGASNCSVAGFVAAGIESDYNASEALYSGFSRFVEIESRDVEGEPVVGFSRWYQNVSDRLAATKKVVLRSIKLFMLGVLLQGGYFYGRDNLTYGVDVTKIRVMVVLQGSL